MLPSAEYLVLPWSTHNGFTIGTGSNAVDMIKIYIPTAFHTSKISWQVVSPDVGQHWSFGIYNLSGTLLVDSGPVLMNNGAPFIIYTATITPVTIGSGMYWLAYTTESGVATVTAIGLDANACDLLCADAGTSTTILATATNPSVSGQLPSSTGVIILNPVTPGADLSPLVKFN